MIEPCYLVTAEDIIGNGKKIFWAYFKVMRVDIKTMKQIMQAGKQEHLVIHLPFPSGALTAKGRIAWMPWYWHIDFLKFHLLRWFNFLDYLFLFSFSFWYELNMLYILKDEMAVRFPEI